MHTNIYIQQTSINNMHRLWVCATTSLQLRVKSSNLPSLKLLIPQWGPLTFDEDFFNHKLPLQIDPQRDFVNEIRQSKVRHLQSLLLAISWQNQHSHSIFTKSKNWFVNKSFLRYKKTHSLSLEHLQVNPKLAEKTNLHTINKKYTYQDKVCERCL